MHIKIFRLARPLDKPTHITFEIMEHADHLHSDQHTGPTHTGQVRTDKTRSKATLVMDKYGKKKMALQPMDDSSDQNHDKHHDKHDILKIVVKRLDKDSLAKLNTNKDECPCILYETNRIQTQTKGSWIITVNVTDSELFKQLQRLNLKLQ